MTGATDNYSLWPGLPYTFLRMEKISCRDNINNSSYRQIQVDAIVVHSQKLYGYKQQIN